MNPRLIAVSGPCEGRIWAVESELLSIGRHPDNDLQLAQLEVSRRHCEIRRERDCFLLRDLESRQGTFVNAQPVRERALAHSDLIQIGDTALLFLLDDPPAPAAPEVDAVPVAGELRPASTIQKRPEETLYLQPQRFRLATPAGGQGQGQQTVGRMATDLAALLELSTATQELREVAPLAARLVELLLGVLAAERGSVLLFEPGAAESVVIAARDRRRGNDVGFAVSRTLLERVVGDRIGLLCTDLTVEPGLGKAASLRGAAVRSLLAAPLVGRERVLGVLYFDTSERGAFAEPDLELVTAAARIAALAFENASYLEGLRHENRRLQAAALEHGMVGESAAMQRLFRFIERVAPADSTILIRGESGTGKELAARALHRGSPRADAPFVAINCATLSETLLESELFGHEKGAFTGAVARKIGKLEVAHTGTLFLDEVGEIPLALQAKLLRVLQEREFERVGGTRPLRADVRIVAATNRDLEAAIREGGFREDLYYRLNVISFTMPPLRERQGDIPLLAQHFVRLHGERLKRRVVGLAPAARRVLMAYDWPGNVRQLGNVIERAVVLGTDERVHAEDLPDEVLGGDGAAASDFQATLIAAKKKLILEAFEQAGGEYQGAAARLGIHVNSLHRLIRNLGLKAQLGK
ncbi:MAG TPA: sigma 54-interacting transcriptional regulator [Polyangia bacterium]|nr:sigma 54-interacting transcriptional regulator [Polyangia bacterium]